MGCTSIASGSPNTAAATSRHWNGGARREPIGDDSSGDDSTRFNAIFDGGGHTISNLFIDLLDTDKVGLFGYTGSSAKLHNIGIDKANVTGNVHVGGLVGLNEGTVSVSYIKGTVTGGSDVGGLVGNNDGTVTQSYSTGSMGGAAQSTRVGGLAGFNQGHGRIATSYSTSKVSGESETGGLVGQNKGAVIGCYATGTVAGVAGGSGTGAGGLVGFHPLGSITASYSTGAVSGPSAAGGLVGAKVAEATVTSSYWDTESSGQSTSSGGVGKSTSELQGPLTTPASTPTGTLTSITHRPQE